MQVTATTEEIHLEMVLVTVASEERLINQPAIIESLLKQFWCSLRSRTFGGGFTRFSRAFPQVSSEQSIVDVLS